MKLNYFLSIGLLSGYTFARPLDENNLEGDDFKLFEESEIEASTNIQTSKGDFTIESRLTNFKKCSSANKKKIQTAFVDAIKIVNSVGTPSLILNHKPGESSEKPKEVYDLWGPQEQWIQGEHIVRGNYERAQLGGTQGWLGDYWYDRYFEITCEDPLDRCSSIEGLHAYENDPDTKEHSGKYPRISFCPRFFKFMPSLEDRVKQVESGELSKKNVENLRSSGSVMLHEMFHTVAKTYAGGYEAGITQPKAIDHRPYQDQESSRGEEKAYGAGRAKYLATMKKRDKSRLVFTNTDNYVYYALGAYMKKKFNTAFPQEPAASWSTPAIKGEEEEFATDDDQNTAESDFSIDEPLLSNEELYESSSNDDKDITCSTSSSSPTLETCLELLDTKWEFEDLWLSSGKPGKSWWFAYQTGCAVSLNFKSDWSVKGDDEDAVEEAICSLTYYDALVSSLKIASKCTKDGKIGGKAPFGKDKCKAELEFIIPEGLPPSGS